MIMTPLTSIFEVRDRISLFSDLPSANLILYKEMTSSIDILEDFSIYDWILLDFAYISHPIFYILYFNGSHFQ